MGRIDATFGENPLARKTTHAKGAVMKNATSGGREALFAIVPWWLLTTPIPTIAGARRVTRASEAITATPNSGSPAAATCATVCIDAPAQDPESSKDRSSALESTGSRGAAASLRRPARLWQ